MEIKDNMPQHNPNPNTRDKRKFKICPRCKGTKINYISFYVRISQYYQNKKIKTKQGILSTSGITLCAHCMYQAGEKQ